jgi:ribosomal subunit interface protein
LSRHRTHPRRIFVDIVVRGRGRDVPERFRSHVTEKLAKLEKFEHRPLRVDVEILQEHNPRLADQAERVEITAHSRGPVIRAEAAADDPYAALDLAYGKLEARLRKMADRRRVHHGRQRPVSVSEATGALAAETLADLDTQAASRSVVSATEQDGAAPTTEIADDGPMIVREKAHEAAPMTLDQALYEMELVGHDFFLFVDEASHQPSVVYRRRGYDYGVIRLTLTVA